MDCNLVYLSIYMPVLVLLISTTDVSATDSSCFDCTDVSVTCIDGECLPRCVDVTSPRECIQCRNFRFYGKQCENVCPHNCLNSRCQLINSLVVCTDGCLTGKKGDKCGEDCPKRCTNCGRYNGSCVGRCPRSNYYGDRCDKLCPSNCKEGCNSIGKCYSCMQGFRGSFCTQACHELCRGGCDRMTGLCRYCAPGYRGRYCTTQCSFTCTQCERYSDRCVGPCANLQYYGDYCDKVCSVNCINGCDRVTWKCNSCTTGQTGRHCNEMCPDGCTDGCDRDTGECTYCKPGTMGIYCNETCPSNCICDTRGAECDSCKSGYRGMHCNELCPSNCTTCHRYKNICIGPCPTDNVYGQDCSIQCAHACYGCDKTSGVCKICATGYSRTYCDEMCSTCTGVMTDCHSDKCTIRAQLILKVLFGVLAVVLVVGTVLILFKHRRRCVKHNGQPKPRAKSRESDQTQYWATKYWEIKDEDMDSDSITNRHLQGGCPRYPLPTQQRRECPQMFSREETPRQGQSQLQTASNRRPMGELCPPGSMLADVDSVLENTLYRSSGACTVRSSSDRQVAGVSTSLDLSDEDIQPRGNRRLIWRDKDGREVSVTSEDLRLATKTDSMLLREENTDFSQVYVKYITPNIHDAACE